jgi:hypothetical protein
MRFLINSKPTEVDGHHLLDRQSRADASGNRLADGFS